MSDHDDRPAGAPLILARLDAIEARLAALVDALVDLDTAAADQTTDQTAGQTAGQATGQAVDRPAAAAAGAWGGAWGNVAGAPPGCVQLTLDGPVDQVSPAAAALGELLTLVSSAPIVRNATPPVQEQRAYLVNVDDVRRLLNQKRAAELVADKPAPPGRVPQPARVRMDDAAQMARHARAALQHLRALEGVATHAGLTIEGDGELARFLAEVSTCLGGLDTWARGSADRSEVPRSLFLGSDGWCHRRGGALPFDALDDADVPADGSWPADWPADAGPRPDTPGVVRMRLGGAEADVADSLALIKSGGITLDGVTSPYRDRDCSGAAPLSRVYAFLNIAAWRREHAAGAAPAGGDVDQDVDG